MGRLRFFSLRHTASAAQGALQPTASAALGALWPHTVALGFWALAACVSGLSGCGDDSGEGVELDASVGAALEGGTVTALPADCPPLNTDAPTRLACTGLYGASGTTEKSVPAQVRPFSPASPLWSDGADKARWIQLPEGAQVDTSRPGVWSFPDGTRAWKEFKHKGKRIETRFFMKLGPGRWRTATYLWNDAETDAVNFAGGDVPVSDGTYHVPTNEECEQCHRGSRDQLLGFEPLLLGMAGAEGLTLPTLVAENKLSHPPSRTSYQIPDDGTGVGPQVLAWMHVNCGVGCHNTNENSYGYPSRLFLRLSPEMLEAGGPSTWDPVRTTLSQTAHTSNFAGATRIVPGAPEASLLMELATTRGNNRAMPPIATRTLDQPNIDLLREWIRRLGGASDGGMDGGAPAAGLEAGVVFDAAVVDAATPDVSLDADTRDAEVDGSVENDAAVVEAPDAGVSAELPDAAVAPEAPDAEVLPEAPDAEVVPEAPDAGVVEVPDAGVVEVPDADIVVEVPDAGVAEPPPPVELPDTGVTEAPDAGVSELPVEIADAGLVPEPPVTDPAAIPISP